MEALYLDLIYIKVVRNGKSGTEVARCSQMRDSAENRQAISRSIATWLSDPFESSSVIPHLFSNILLNFTVETLTPKAQVKAKVLHSVSTFPSQSFTRILSAGRISSLIE